MPKSKRDQIVSLTKTAAKGRGHKVELIESLRKSCDEYAWCFLFSLAHSRNASLREVRDEWSTSRMFLGKVKVSQIALGRDAESEYKEGLHQISKRLTGARGLLFTNTPKDDVIKWFEGFRKPDFARGGSIASETVVLPAGQLPFTHSMESHIRTLGLPVTVLNGHLMLSGEHTVCEAGKILTPEQAQILKLLGKRLAVFKITIEAGWSNGKFESYVAPPEEGQGAGEGSGGDMLEG